MRSEIFQLKWPHTHLRNCSFHGLGLEYGKIHLFMNSKQEKCVKLSTRSSQQSHRIVEFIYMHADSLTKVFWNPNPPSSSSSSFLEYPASMESTMYIGLSGRCSGTRCSANNVFIFLIFLCSLCSHECNHERRSRKLHMHIQIVHSRESTFKKHHTEL